MEKDTLRREIKAKVAKLSGREISKDNKAINSHICVSRLFLEGKVIMGYLAQGKEVNIDTSLQQAINSGKIVCVPRVLEENGQMEIVRLTALKNLGKDRYGIRIPQAPYEVIDPSEVDLVLVPAVAYTAQGNRMGRGGGYYDRFLPRCTKAVPMGVAFESQVVEEMPVNAHDQNVRYLVTETGLRVCKQK